LNTVANYIEAHADQYPLPVYIRKVLHCLNDMEVVQDPYKASDREAVTEDQRKFGPLGLGGLEQGDQFRGSADCGRGMIF
jgi:hypothetical protein